MNRNQPIQSIRSTDKPADAEISESDEEFLASLDVEEASLLEAFGRYEDFEGMEDFEDPEDFNAPEDSGSSPAIKISEPQRFDENRRKAGSVGKRTAAAGKAPASGSLPAVLLPAMIALAVMIAAGLFAILFLVPLGEKPALSGDPVSVTLNTNSAILSWSAPHNAEQVRVYLMNEDSGEYELYETCSGNTLVLKELPENTVLRLQLEAVHEATTLMGRTVEQVSARKELAVDLSEPAPIILTLTSRPADRAVDITWNGTEGRSYIISAAVNKTDNWTELETTQAHSCTLSYETFLSLYDTLSTEPESVILHIREMEDGGDYVCNFGLSDDLEISRSMFLTTDLQLNCADEGDGVYTLSWNEAQGNYFVLQERASDKDNWSLVRQFPWNEGTWSYRTDQLPSGSYREYRVVSMEYMEFYETRDFLSVSDTVSFRAPFRTESCQIWPIIELPLLAAADPDAEVLSKVPAGTALRILSEENGFFKASFDEKEGWLDSDYCMIDLAQYLGDFCEYNITNSYSSIFRANIYDLPGLTDEVIPGFENICQEKDSYLVPFLYPCAQKLIAAGTAAEKDGYRLRIYEAFRPGEATRYLYDTVSAILKDPVPPSEEQLETFAKENNPDPALPTYEQVITNGTFNLGAFLAASVSAHNRGIALDLTLVDITTGEELPMQSSIHDLSWHSILSYNNENADLLAKYMKNAGFHDLTSEWWHFQDDETRSALSLGSYLVKGVGPAE